MEYRAGKCSQCGAEYQVPASFAHNVARCKKCGVGVVHLGAPARSAGNPEGTAPSRPAAPEPAAARSAPPPSERAPGGQVDRPAERRAEPARASSAPAPLRPRPEPREPSPAAVPGEREPSATGGRSPRAVLIGIGLLLVVAAVCFWLFYLRDKA